MPSTSSDRDLVEVLAEEFVERHRRGERPALTEYTDRCPDRADEIRNLFPALVVMEQLKPTGDHTAGFDGQKDNVDRRLPERLGDYRILREVGRGGMGVVYEAEQVSLGRHVALKVLPVHGLMNPTYLERFRREAKAAAKLHHTNIVPVFGVGEAEGVHFYAMQFIRGEGLDKVLDDVRCMRGQAAGLGTVTETRHALQQSVAQSLLEGSFAGPEPPPRDPTVPAPPTSQPAKESGSSISGFSTAGRSNADYFRSVARIGLQAAEALAYAHKQGILHRDVKPSNLLLDQQGTVWITDFGLAKSEGTEELTHAGDIVGTIRFMAPERFDGQSSPQSDIYSLGITLYEMLALRPAFDASHRAKLIEQVMRESPPSLGRLDQRMPRDLETIIQKCVAKEPRDRYATAEALAEDLRRFLADRPIKARRATLAEQLWRWRRRNPALAAALAAVFLLLVTVAVGSTVATIWLRSALTTSEKNRSAADEARHKTDVQRWEATFEQAKANRLSRRPGQRFKTLELLRQCAAESKVLDLPAERRAELRNAVIATLAMPDLDLEEIGDYTLGNEADFDGNFESYAITDAKGNCSIRRVADGVEVDRLPGTGTRTVPICSHSGQFLALHVYGGSVQLWEHGDAGWQRRLTPDHVNAVCFRPDDRMVAFGHDDGSISVYELPAGALRFRLAPETIGKNISIALHPTAPVIACASYYGSLAQVRDLRSGSVLAKVEGLDHPHFPVWHPDGRNLIIPDGEGGKIHHYAWDPSAQTLSHRRSFETNSGGIRIAFNPAGDRFASLGWNSVMHLFDFESGQLLFQAPSVWWQTVPRFDATGTRLAGAVLRQGGKLSVWRVSDGRDYRTVVHEPLTVREAFGSAAVHPDGRLLAAGINGRGLGLWDLESGQRLAYLPQVGVKGVNVVFDRAGSLYTTSWAGTFRWPVRSAAGSTDGYAFGPPELLPFGRGHSELAISPDGRIRAKGFGFGYGEAPYAGAWVQFADRTGAPIRLPGVVSCSNVSVSRDGRWLAAGKHNSSVHVFEVIDGHRLKQVRELPGVGPYCRFSPDDRWLWTGLGGGRLYHVGTWEPGPACEGQYCAFSPVGNLLATTLTTGSVILRDTDSRQELARLEDPNLDASNPPVFSPDGTKLITLTNDNVKAVHVWDLRRIRSVLKEMDLDWDSPAFPPQGEVRPLTTAEFVRPDLAKLPANWNPGIAAAEQDRWQGRVAIYSLSLALQPLNPEAYFRRGYAHHQLKQEREAVADFDRALALRPEHTETLHWRAHAFEQLAQWDRADADFSAALALKPDDAHFLDRRGRCRLNLNRFDDGIADLEHSLAIRTQQPELVRFLAVTCNNQAWKLLTGPVADRDPAAALKLAEKAAKYRPDEQLYINTLGVAQYRNGNLKSAVATLEKSLQAGNGNFEAFDLYFLAMCHAQLKDAAKAKDCFDRAVKWHDERNAKLSENHRQELREFRTEAEKLLTPKR